MKISEVIKILEREQKIHGDVDLSYENGDGHSSWISDFQPVLRYHQPWPAKSKIWTFNHNGY